MAKNRLKKLFSHLVVIMIFFTNKIWLSIFRLEYWWDVVKSPNTPFLQVWWDWWVLVGRNVAWTSKYPDIRGFCPVGPPTKRSVIFLSSLQR